MHYPAVMSEDDTLDAALAGRSLARFGDGELKIATGRHAKSQEGKPALQATLLRILRDTTGPCLPCIPSQNPTSPKAYFWEDYATRRYVQLLRADGVYGSSLITRPDSAPWIARPDYWAKVERLWAGKDVVLVRGAGGKALQPADLASAASVVEILGPVSNAWTMAPRLLDQAAAAAGGRKTVLLCLGATATALAWSLAQNGVHAVDLGHIALFMRKAGRGEDATVKTEADMA